MIDQAVTIALNCVELLGRNESLTGGEKMDASEPRVRRRGFVVIPTDPSLDDEMESAEGVTVRVRITRPRLRKQLSVVRARGAGNLARGSSATRPTDSSTTSTEVKSEIATGIRQRSHSRR